MIDREPECPQCGKTMELGHIPDLAHNRIIQSTWAPGTATRRKFWGGIRWEKQAQVPIAAYRCPKCGYLALYARPTYP